MQDLFNVVRNILYMFVFICIIYILFIGSVFSIVMFIDPKEYIKEINNFNDLIRLHFIPRFVFLVTVPTFMIVLSLIIVLFIPKNEEN